MRILMRLSAKCLARISPDREKRSHFLGSAGRPSERGIHQFGVRLFRQAGPGDLSPNHRCCARNTCLTAMWYEEPPLFPGVSRIPLPGCYQGISEGGAFEGNSSRPNMWRLQCAVGRTEVLVAMRRLCRVEKKGSAPCFRSFY